MYLLQNNRTNFKMFCGIIIRGEDQHFVRENNYFFHFGCFSEVQTGHTADVGTVVESCRRNKVALKGIISSPQFAEGGILQTLNMKIRYVFG